MERIASELDVAHDPQAEQRSQVPRSPELSSLCVCVPSNLSPPLTSGRLLSINNFVVAISGRGGGGGAGPSTQIIRADS